MDIIHFGSQLYVPGLKAYNSLRLFRSSSAIVMKSLQGDTLRYFDKANESVTETLDCNSAPAMMISCVSSPSGVQFIQSREASLWAYFLSLGFLLRSSTVHENFLASESGNVTLNIQYKRL